VADQLAFALETTSPCTYRQRGASTLQSLFQRHFAEFCARYEADYARRLGRIRLERIRRVVQRFLDCGNYTRGVARIQCTNPNCKSEYFRPFSCKTFYICPSCSQKRTLLFAEYMNERLMLRLPHRQFVFTLPKVLRVFFRHDRQLHGEISRLIHRLLQDFFTAAAGMRIRTGGVIAFQTSGEFVRWNPHWHGLFLEGGFDRNGRFVHIPTMNLAKMSACFRHRVVEFFRQRQLLNERLAKNMLEWTHSGFSVDGSVGIPAGSPKAREALSQYIARPPVSLKKLLVEEGGTDSVLYYTAYNDYFRTNAKLFSASDFLAELLQHLPEPRTRLIRAYGLYSSRARGTWLRMPYLVRLAPEGWKQDHSPPPSACVGAPGEPQPDCSVSAMECRSAWARLIAKVYEVDPLVCLSCGAAMRVLAVITEPQQVLKILRHLVKIGTPPPGLDPASLN